MDTSEQYNIHDAAMDIARCGMASYAEAYTAIEYIIDREKYNNSIHNIVLFLDRFQYWKRRLRHT